MDFPKTGYDGSKHHGQYILTSQLEPIVISEYVSDFNSPSTHILQLDDCENGPNPRYKEERYHELVLDTRPGREFFTYARKCETDNLMEFIEKIK